MKGGTPLAEVVAWLNDAAIDHAVVGSFASSQFGHPRTTNDIDVIIDPTLESLELFLASVDRARYYLPDETARAAIAAADQFNVVSLESIWKLDLIVLDKTPFARAQMDRRLPVEIDGAQVFVASPEDTVLAKLRWHRMGGSDRQLRDASGVLEVMAGTLDDAYLDHWASELGVRDLLTEVRESSAPDA